MYADRRTDPATLATRTGGAAAAAARVAATSATCSATDPSRAAANQEATAISVASARGRVEGGDDFCCEQGQYGLAPHFYWQSKEGFALLSMLSGSACMETVYLIQLTASCWQRRILGCRMNVIYV
eukprot:4839863-Pleurochrysis_carterae.AAC.1